VIDFCSGIERKAAKWQSRPASFGRSPGKSEWNTD